MPRVIEVVVDSLDWGAKRGAAAGNTCQSLLLADYWCECLNQVLERKGVLGAHTQLILSTKTFSELRKLQFIIMYAALHWLAP